MQLWGKTFQVNFQALSRIDGGSTARPNAPIHVHVSVLAAE